MLIVSRFKDYYDYVSNIYGSDPKIVYRRGMVVDDGTDTFYPKIKPALIPYPRDHNGMYYEFRYLIVNGRYFPLFKKREIGVIGSNAEFTLATRDKDEYAYRVIVEGYTRFNYFRSGSFNLDSDITHPHLIELSKLVRNPVFVITKVSHDGGVTIQHSCPNLAAIGLSQVYEPEQLYQDISYFVSNILNPSPDMMPAPKPPMTDKEKILSHGFDVKTSFRGKRK